MTKMYPTASLRKKISPEGSKSAGPLLYGFARRSLRGMPANNRQIRALASYLPMAPAHVFEALGGSDALEWAHSIIDEIGLDDQHEPNGTGEITVLGLPYGGPNGGKDSEGQYFSPMTDFIDGAIDEPPVYYTHGSQNGFEPEPLGKVTKRWYDRRGGWFKVKLDPQSPRYSQILEAHSTGNLRASSGAVPASYTADASTGHIDTWLVGELSLVDLRDGFRPVNGYAITKSTKAEEVLFQGYYGDDVLLDPEADAEDLLQEAITLQEAACNETDNVIVKLLRGALALLKRATGNNNTHDDTLYGDYTMSKASEEAPAEDKKEEMEDTQKIEKCAACDEAKRMADEVKAEIAGAVKCARCPEAVTWVKAMFKAGRITPTEAFGYLDTFTQSDDTFAAVKAEVEGRSITKAQPNGLFIAGGGNAVDPQTVVDPEHMNKQRKLLGIPTK